MPLFVCNHILPYLLEKVGCKYKIVQRLALGGKNILFGTDPLLMALVQENNILPNTHYRVHVVRIDDSGHVVFFGNVADQFIYQQGGFRVQSGVRFIAKQVFRIQHDGPGNGHPYFAFPH